MQIDPRYEAALDQALAKKAQDEANLKNAQIDLQRCTALAKEDLIARQQLDTQQAMVDLTRCTDQRRSGGERSQH